MNNEIWSAVDRYFQDAFLKRDEILESVLERCRQAGLPDINVSPCQGQLLAIVTKISKAKRILEIGTLGGYSTIWFARALPSDGMILSIELMEDYAKLARENITLAHVDRKAMVICGDARMVMERLIDDAVEPFDLIFIDADKPSNPIYLALAVKLARSGTVIISDNVVREGAVADENTVDPKVIGIRQYCEDLSKLGWESTAIQTVGVKGYDGFSITMVP
ncbi:MAG: O-methyltransferase [Planctomycetes bacterium]|nr:O-methyltransferase [Planctomycetota bacterium]